MSKNNLLQLWQIMRLSLKQILRKLEN
jgi:hypothetical protein